MGDRSKPGNRNLSWGNRNDKPRSVGDIVNVLGDNYLRANSEALNEKKVRNALRGNMVERRKIESAGGGNLLPLI